MTRAKWGFVGLSVAGAALAGISATVAAGSVTASRLSAYSVTVGVVLVWSVGLLLWSRPSSRRVARLLFLLAFAYFVRGLAISDNDWLFSITRALGQLAEFVLVWVMLAFPSGRLRSVHDRIIVGCAAFTAFFLWIPTVLLSQTVPLAGPIAACGDSCPENVLLVADNPSLAAAFQAAFRWSGTLLLVATAASLAVRLIRASPLTRRTLAPVLVVSILRTLAVAAFIGSGGSILSGEILVVLFWCVPLSMALGLLLGRLYSASALKRLVSGLQKRPDAVALRAVMADALEDPELEINYWVPDRAQWVDSTGGFTDQVPVPGSDRAATLINQPDGSPLAEIVHDESMLEQPDLIEAAIASTRLALQTNQMQAELTLSDERVQAAQSRAQRSLERDLHDGAQQRLIALRMKVSVLTRIMDQDSRRAAELARELGPDIEAALSEVRDVAHGRGHRTLTAQGLAAALDDLITRSPFPVTLAMENIGRYPSPIEGAVYLTCSEALQNVGKHAGPGVSVMVTLADDGEWLSLSVVDNGKWRGSNSQATGHGMTNMRERILDVGGSLTVGSDGGGMAVRARVPVT